MKRFLILFFLISMFTSYGQCKKPIEEIAIYHLHNLTQDGKLLQNFNYFTNGYLKKDTTDINIVLLFPRLKYKKDTNLLTNPFKECTIVEKNNLKMLSIPNNFRHEKKNPNLNIYRATKNADKYYVEFSLESDTDSPGAGIILIMDLNGDLINLNYFGYSE